jgi:hypothetical protein
MVVQTPMDRRRAVRIHRTCLRAAFPALLLALLSTPPRTNADETHQGPFEGLYGGDSTRHRFPSLPRVVGSVIVELSCRADLGCDGWDYFNCNSPPPYACDILPEDKWVTLTICGTAINGTLSYIGVPGGGGPPVPDDGKFFKDWHFEDPDYPECGFSDCYNDEQHIQLTNIHRFTVAQDQWNAWLAAHGGTIIMYAISSSATMDLPAYCAQHASGDDCCHWPDEAGTCSERPGSNATIRISYTRSGRCCYPDATCEETSYNNCTAMGGVWTDGETCDSVACPSGACCIGNRGTPYSFLIGSLLPPGRLRMQHAAKQALHATQKALASRRPAGALVAPQFLNHLGCRAA